MSETSGYLEYGVEFPAAPYTNFEKIKLKVDFPLWHFGAIALMAAESNGQAVNPNQSKLASSLDHTQLDTPVGAGRTVLDVLFQLRDITDRRNRVGLMRESQPLVDPSLKISHVIKELPPSEQWRCAELLNTARLNQPVRAVAIELQQQARSPLLLEISALHLTALLGTEESKPHFPRALFTNIAVDDGIDTRFEERSAHRLSVSVGYIHQFSVRTTDQPVGFSYVHAWSKVLSSLDFSNTLPEV